MIAARPPAPTPRRADAADETSVVRVLARAFDADPVANYLLRRDAGRARAFELVFGAFVRHVFLPRGEVWIAGDAPDADGAALWTPPGAWRIGLRETLAMGPSLLRAVGVTRALAKATAADRVQRKHPDAPHWYLFAVGVSPDRQGRGVGSALLAAVLDRCDASGAPAYLEASKEENARLYARHGFRVLEEMRMAPDAPPVWRMWRDARAR